MGRKLVTVEELHADHEAVLASLSVAQRRAVARDFEARSMMVLATSEATIAARLDKILRAEADALNQAFST